MCEYTSDNVTNDPDNYVLDMISDCRRLATHAEFGLHFIAIANTMQDLVDRNEVLLNKLRTIEDMINKALR